MCSTPDGIHRWGDELLQAIREPNITRAKVERFRIVAESVQNGVTSADEATSELQEVSDTFAKILQFANTNEKMMSLLLAFLLIIITYYGIICSNESSVLSHDDSRAQTQAIEMQTKAYQSSEQAHLSVEQAQLKIDAKIAEMNDLSESRQSNQLRKSIGQRQTPKGAGNRHERRKADALARR